MFQNPFVLIAILFIVLAGGIWKFIHRQKLNKVARKRPPLSRLEFIKKMKDQGFEYDKINTVYKEVVAYVETDNFDLYPEDDLLRFIRIADTDLEHIMEELFEEFELKPLSQELVDREYNKNQKIVNCVFLLKLLH